MHDGVNEPEDRDELPRATTLGARLDAAGRDLLGRRRTRFVWSGALQTLLEHVGGLGQRPDRFERFERRPYEDLAHRTSRPDRPVPLPVLTLPGDRLVRERSEHEPPPASI